jgi:hypothetical protein
MTKEQIADEAKYFVNNYRAKIGGWCMLDFGVYIHNLTLEQVNNRLNNDSLECFDIQTMKINK